MVEPNVGEEPTAVIGAGIVGCTIAWALTRVGQRVVLIDRAPPATAGASFGNAGHIATEQLEPLPSVSLLLGFWRELLAFGGPLDIPLRRLIPLAPWIARFVRAAFHQAQNATYLAPLAASAADTLERQLTEIGRGDLLRRNGHYAVWLGASAARCALSERRHAEHIGVSTAQAPADLLQLVASGTTQSSVAGVWFPDSAHVLDPSEVAQAFAAACAQRGAEIVRMSVRAIRPRGTHIEIVGDTGSMLVRRAVVCAGAWSRPLLAAFGLHAPLEAERGYHVELPGHAPLADAPIVYADHRVIVTPMASRLRATSFLEFAGLTAPADPRKPARLRASLRRLGYQCPPEGSGWMGPRPTLPDYLPGIGRAAAPHELFYAVGHQHLGLTLAAVTAELIAALVVGQPPRFEVRPFDLRRFGTA